MRSSWYNQSRQCVALRKHVLRVDLCIFIDDEKAFTNLSFLESTIKSILTASIIKGLDVVGILTKDTPSIGLRALQMAKQQKMDIVVVPGQTYECRDGESLYIYRLKKPVTPNLSLEEVCRLVHKMGGMVIIANVGKRLAQTLDKLQGSDSAPDAVEIFNAKSGGYRDLNIDFPKVISSGATSATDLESTNVFTLVERKKAEEMKLLLPGEGLDYTPKYLLPESERQI